MPSSLWETFEPQLISAMRRVCDEHPDPSHDFSHVLRVVSQAKQIALSEGADFDVVVPAAYLHDFEFVSKGSPLRSRASTLSAAKAKEFLREQGYPQNFLEPIAHAIEAHSFSAGITPRTLEARVVQDADRLDALGSIGIARCFALSGQLNRSFYAPVDPFCETRTPNDQMNSLDHFFIKLLRIAETLHTAGARFEAQARVQLMQQFLSQLRQEIAPGLGRTPLSR